MLLSSPVQSLIARMTNTRVEQEHTQTLAALLDPCGDHGAGDCFLREFANQLRLREDTEKAVRILDGALASRRRMVKPEQSLEYEAGRYSAGRVDIWIEGPLGVLMIENKTTDMIRPEQIRKYAEYRDHLERQGRGECVFAFLTPDGKMPCEIDGGISSSAPDFGLSYSGDILPWLMKCHAYCVAAGNDLLAEGLANYAATIHASCFHGRSAPVCATPPPKPVMHRARGMTDDERKSILTSFWTELAEQGDRAFIPLGFCRGIDEMPDASAEVIYAYLANLRLGPMKPKYHGHAWKIASVEGQDVFLRLENGENKIYCGIRMNRRRNRIDPDTARRLVSLAGQIGCVDLSSLSHFNSSGWFGSAIMDQRQYGLRDDVCLTELSDPAIRRQRVEHLVNFAAEKIRMFLAGAKPFLDRA